MLPLEVVDQLTAFFGELCVDPTQQFYSSNVHAPREIARRVDTQLKAVVTPYLTSLLGDVEPFMAAFISKGSQVSPLVHYHQDWTYTDERTHRATLAWIPLVDTSLANGAMSVVAGSHLWSQGIRSDRADPPTDEIQLPLSVVATFMPLRAGEGLLYDPGLIHGTSPNRSRRPRPAVAIAFAPRGAQLTFFHMDSSGELKGYAVKESYFTTVPFRSVPVDRPALVAWAPPVSSEDLVTALDPKIPRVAEATGSSSGTTVVSGAESKHPGRSSRARGALLADSRLDRRLERHGFARFRLLEPDVARNLRAEFSRLHGLVETDADDDPSISAPYRRAAARAIESALDGPLAAHMVGSSPFLQRFEVAWPGGAAGEPHQDWSFIDERNGLTTHTVWLALEDVEGHNGQLRILRGSHLLPRSLRGPGLAAAWLSHTQVIEDRLVAVPLRIGECLVLNASLVRASFANSTSRPRVAAVFSMIPTGESLLHARRSADGGTRVARVDAGFFDICRPNSPDTIPPWSCGLFESEPGLGVVGEGHRGTLGEAELARFLDREAGAPAQAARRRLARVRAALRRDTPLGEDSLPSC